MRYKHETNFVGMMLAALMFFLVIGSVIQFDSKGKIQIIDTTSLYKNEITGAVSGLESVSGFATIAEQNNNPLNIKTSDTQDNCKCWESGVPIVGYTGRDSSGHAKFESVEKGYAAGIKFIERAKSGKNANFNVDMTLAAFFAKYVGEGGNIGNHQTFAIELGYNPDVTKLRDIDPVSLAPKIARAEDSGYYNKLTSQNFFTTYSYSAATTGTAQASVKVTIPKFDVSDIAQFQNQMNAYIESVKKEAEKKALQQEQKRLEAAAKTWLRNPKSDEARKNFENEAFKFQLSKDPYKLVSTFKAGTQEEKKLAEEILTNNYNNKNIMQTLKSDGSPETKTLLTKIVLEKGKETQAYQVLSSGEKSAMDAHLQNNDIARKAGVSYVPEKQIFVNSQGFIVNINYDVASKRYSATATKEKYIDTTEPGKLPFTEEQQAAIKAQGLIPFSDGRITDTLGNEYSNVLAFNPSGKTPQEKWKVYLETKTPPKKIKVGAAEINIHPGNYFTQNGLAVYKDSKGKLYDQTGNELKAGLLTKPETIGKVKTELSFQIKDGKIDTSQPIQARISGIEVPVASYEEIKGIIKSAGSKAEVKGLNLNTGPMLITDGKDLKATVSKLTEEYEGITQGLRIEKDYKDGEPLSIKTVSGDGRITITENREFVDWDTGRKDVNGNPVIEKRIRTKNWVKLEQTDKSINDGGGKELYKLIERTERKYVIDENTGKQTEDYTDIVTDSRTGEPLRIGIKKGSQSLNAEFKDGQVTGDSEAMARLSTLRSQHEWRQRFATLEAALTQFRGLGYYASWFLGDEELDEWRESVDKVFAETYLGIEYWESAICAADIDRDSKGVAYVDTRLGLAAVAAHIEASRSEEVILPPGENKTREFLYKITFNVKNGDWDEDPKALEKMKFNIELRGERTATVFRNDISLSRGNSFGRIGNDAIVQFSGFRYDKICIVFDEIPYSWSLDNEELCNTITTPSGPTRIGQPAGGQQGEEGEVVEGNINDF